MKSISKPLTRRKLVERIAYAAPAVLMVVKASQRPALAASAGQRPRSNTFR